MTIGELRKLLQDADDEGPVVFLLGDVATRLNAREYNATSTKDAVFIEFVVPEGWERK